MRRLLALVAAAMLVGVAAVAFAGWRWTHTPHGRMDLGAAIVVHTMPGGGDFTPEARKTANAWVARFMDEAEPSVAIRDLTFAGPAGEEPLRIYVPPGPGPFPVVAWIHGGGFWMGDDLPIWDGMNSRLAAAAGAIVASIGYRLAPEHPFPAAVEDSFAGLSFVAEHAAEWNGDPSRLAVMGESAGGNLAAVMALRARAEGEPRLVYQVLVVPAVAADDLTESREIFAKGYGLDAIAQMVDAYLPNRADRSKVWASPLLADDFAGLPPALVLTAEFDPLRDEGEAYAEKLRAAGVAVTLQRFDGAIHGFLGSDDDSRASELLAATKLREAFAP
jgi:acetyl esterase